MEQYAFTGAILCPMIAIDWVYKYIMIDSKRYKTHYLYKPLKATKNKYDFIGTLLFWILPLASIYLIGLLLNRIINKVRPYINHFNNLKW